MIQTQYIPDRYIGTGAVDTYPFSWPILAKGDLVATTKDVGGVVTTLALDVDYTIDDADVGIDADGGSIVLTVDLPSGTILVLTRHTSPTQLVDILEGGTFPAATVMEMADKLTLIVQEQYYLARQSLKFGITSEFLDVDVPDPEDDLFLSWRDGLLVNSTLSQVGDEVDVSEGAEDVDITFLTAADNTTYRVVTLTTNWNTTADWSARTVDGFTVTFGTPAPAGAKLTWGIVP